jgi:1-phosphofructokinase
MEAESVRAVTVPVAGRTRSNVTLVERADGTVTQVNEPGGALTAEDLERITEAALACTGATDWVVLCGSLPPGVAVDVYAELVRRFAAAGALVAVDTSGPALLEALAAKPDLVKPNWDELAEVVGRPLPDLASVVEAAEELRNRGARAVLVSLGPDGAVLVDDSGPCLARGPEIEPRSTVGAGDALLAGYLSAFGSGLKAVIEAVAWGGAAVGLPGSAMPRPADISREGVEIYSGFLGAGVGPLLNAEQ